MLGGQLDRSIQRLLYSCYTLPAHTNTPHTSALTLGGASVCLARKKKRALRVSPECETMRVTDVDDTTGWEGATSENRSSLNMISR